MFLTEVVRAGLFIFTFWDQWSDVNYIISFHSVVTWSYSVLLCIYIRLKGKSTLQFKLYVYLCTLYYKQTTKITTMNGNTQNTFEHVKWIPPWRHWSKVPLKTSATIDNAVPKTHQWHAEATNWNKRVYDAQLSFPLDY